MHWSSRDVQYLSGATERQLVSWVAHGWLNPDRDGDGPGYSWRWPFEQLLGAAMLSAACPPAGKRTTFPARWGPKIAQAPLDGEWLTLEPEVRSATPDDVLGFLAENEAVTVVCLGRLRRSLEAQVAA